MSLHLPVETWHDPSAVSQVLVDAGTAAHTHSGGGDEVGGADENDQVWFFVFVGSEPNFDR